MTSPLSRRVLRICLLCCLFAVAAQAASQGTALLEARAFPLQGPTAGLEPQVLDFRYAPYRWQTCIGLPDDPHKSIVGSDGGLYYDYGGGRFYDFKTRILASLETTGPEGEIRQRLHDARTPIVVTERDRGELTLEQHAWARAPRTADLDEWSERRVDYLWLKLVNKGTRAATGRIVVQIDPASPVTVSDNARLIDKRDSNVTFASMSPPCTHIEHASPPQTQLMLDHQPGTHRNWARPKIDCDRRFRDVLVGWSRPLVFTFPAEPDKMYRVAFGLIEGYHPNPGLRPLEIRIEGKTVRAVDLVGEFGQNQPVVLCFDTKDRNRDGRLEMGVYPAAGAEDDNTILSGLWVFDPAAAPSEKTILAGNADRAALAMADINTLARQDNKLKLFFEDKTLAPGQECRVLLTLARGKNASVQTPESSASRERDRAVKYWQQVDLPYGRMIVPDPNVQDLLDACIRNIYQAREIKEGRPAFQVGPTCYRGTWAADGPFILEAVTYLGRARETRAGLEQQVDRDQGPGGVAFSKKSGLRLWMIRRHAQLTGDRAWLQATWPRVEREVNQIIEYRRITMDDPNQANYGLMPIGFGDGGLGGKHREYTNVYWTLAGLKAAIDMAAELGKPCRAAWQAEYDDYWSTFDRARNRDKLTDAFGNVYVPVTMTGEAPQLPQRGAWAFLQSIFPGRIFDANDKLMLGTMAMLDATEKEGLIFGTGWLPDGVWNYAASFYGHAHLWLGHGRKAAATLYAFGNHASPLLCWREEQNLVGRAERYCGDMPHNWASAEFIRLTRHLLILERGRELHLLEGLPAAWTRPGNRTELKNVPTSFGEMSVALEVRPDGDAADLKIELPRREPFERVVLHLENFDRPVRRIRCNGTPLPTAAQRVSCDAPLLLTVEFDE